MQDSWSHAIEYMRAWFCNELRAGPEEEGGESVPSGI